MEQTAAATLLSTEDVILEILHRVSTDAAALFRCAVACKRWRTLIADRSFLRRCWPENAPSALLGFFARQLVEAADLGPYRRRLFFVPPPAGSVLGNKRRLLTSIVKDVPDDHSHLAEPLAARRGLLLLQLDSEIRYNELVHLAVCDPVARTCHLLPPLECRVTFISCTVLNGAECRQNQGCSDDYFKVLAIVLSDNKYYNVHECNLYTFTSTQSQWSAPTKCFDEIYRFNRSGFAFEESHNVVCGAMAHWLVPYYFAYDAEPPKYYTLDVSAGTGHTSLTEISIPANQYGTAFFLRGLTLGTTVDGSLSLFSIQDKPPIRRVHMWKRGNDVNTKVWLHTKVVELNIPAYPFYLRGVHMFPLEKSDTLLVLDESECMYKMDVKTGEVEEQQFQNMQGISAIPMNIEWPTLFASRLG